MKTKEPTQRGRLGSLRFSATPSGLAQLLLMHPSCMSDDEIWTAIKKAYPKAQRSVIAWSRHYLTKRKGVVLPTKATKKRMTRKIDRNVKKKKATHKRKTRLSLRKKYDDLLTGTLRSIGRRRRVAGFSRLPRAELITTLLRLDIIEGGAG